MKLGVLAFFTTLALVGAPLISLGQFSTERTFELEVAPRYPAPGEPVHIYAETYSFDIARAQVRWQVDGVPYREGRGVRSITLLAPQAHETKVVSFSATLGGETLSRSITIAPVIIDLILEPQTYVPPFYPGKALVSHRSQVRAVALPELRTPGGALYAPEALSFTWRINGDTRGELSGPGRSVITFSAGPLSRSTTVEVEVVSLDGLRAGRTSTTVPSIAPQPLLYAVSPLAGPDYAKALGSGTVLEEDEVTILAEPFYARGIRRDVLQTEYSWSLNGRSVATTNTDPGTITLRQAGAGRGRATIGVSVTDPSEVLARASAVATFIFGREGRGIFGF